MKLSAILAPLVARNADAQTIMDVVLAYEGEQSNALELRREADRERQARKRSRDVTLGHSDQPLTGAGDVRVSDKTSNSEIEPQKESKKRAFALSPEFEEFWSAYPNKVGKPKALASFQAALKRAAHCEIMAGLRRYVAGKPVDRAWLNPATFLNQDRFNDQPANVTPMARGSPASQAPSMPEMLRLIRDHPHEDQPEPPEDRSGFRAAIPHLRTFGAG